MNVVLLLLSSVIAIGSSPNADAHIKSFLMDLQFETVFVGEPTETRQVYERITFDIDLCLYYEDMENLIDEDTIYANSYEIIVDYEDAAGPGPFVSKRIFEYQLYDLSIYNSLLTGYFAAQYIVYLTGIEGEETISNYVDSSFSYDLGIQSENINFNTYSEVLEISTGENEAYQEGYNEGYNDGYKDGHADGYAEGEEYGEMIGYENGKNDGYDLGFNAGLNNTNLVDSAISLVKGVFSALDTILNIEIIPGLKLSIILLIPIAFGVIQFFLNLWR